MSPFNQELAMEMDFQVLLMDIFNRQDLEQAVKYKGIDCFQLLCAQRNLINRCIKNEDFAHFCANLTNLIPPDLAASQSIYKIMR